MSIDYGSEDEYQGAIVAGLEAKGWAIQVHSDENCRYIPDLSFSANGIGGWIEVKYCPQRPKTLGHIKHYTKGQELWLRMHGEKGTGHCYVLVGTPWEHFLVRWDALKLARTTPFLSLLSLLGVCVTPTLQEMCYFLNRHISGR